jgi:hypothetical protein
MPFERAQTFLAMYHHIHVSHDTVNDTTVAIGQALREQQRAAIQQAWEECRLPTCEVATPPKRLYVSADGISYLLANGEGKEIKLAAVYEAEERRNRKGEIEICAKDIEYVVATDPEDLARAAYLIAVKQGVESAEQIIILGDGASWIWNHIVAMFPRHKTTEIVDFYHASEYIWDAGKAVLGEGTGETKDCGGKYCHRLQHDGPAPLLLELHTLSPACSTTPEPVVKAITYFKTTRRELLSDSQHGIYQRSRLAERRR